jgi:hypothetical protein
MSMRRSPVTIAAAITLVALGATSTLVLRPAADNGSPATAPVEIRTQVIRRTVRVVRHEKPKQRPAVRGVIAAGPPTPGTALAATAAAPPAGPGSPASGTVAAVPLSTRTSGSAGSSQGSQSGPGQAGSPASGSAGSGVATSRPLSTRTSASAPSAKADDGGGHRDD